MTDFAAPVVCIAPPRVPQVTVAPPLSGNIPTVILRGPPGPPGAEYVFPTLLDCGGATTSTGA